MTDDAQGAPDNDPPDFGQQVIGYRDPHPWVTPLIGGLAFGAFMVMVMMGKAPWQ